jgi:hypothetical protein
MTISASLTRFAVEAIWIEFNLNHAAQTNDGPSAFQHVAFRSAAARRSRQ